MTIASGAGLCCAENHTRSRRSNQNTAGTGRAQGSAILISCSGTVSGIGAMSCGGVPNTVARSAPGSASPVAGPILAAGAGTCAATGTIAANVRCASAVSADGILTPISRGAAVRDVRRDMNCCRAYASNRPKAGCPLSPAKASRASLRAIAGNDPHSGAIQIESCFEWAAAQRPAPASGGAMPGTRRSLTLQVFARPHGTARGRNECSQEACPSSG